MENYPDEATSFGFHVIRITLQHGEHQASFTYTVYGNSRGASLLPFFFNTEDIAFYKSDELLFQSVPEHSGVISVALKGRDGIRTPKEFTVAELNDMVVKSELVSFTEDKYSVGFLETGKEVNISCKSDSKFRILSAQDKSKWLFLLASRNWWWALKNLLCS